MVEYRPLFKLKIKQLKSHPQGDLRDINCEHLEKKIYVITLLHKVMFIAL